MDRDLKKFRDLILAIFHHHGTPESYSHGPARDIFYQIQGAFPYFGKREELEKFLPSEEDVKKEFGRTLLYLKPVTHGPTLVPALSIKCDFGRSVPEVGLHLGIFLEHHGTIKFFGFRFEAPHGEGSVHHYYHMQMIRSVLGVALPDDGHSVFIPDAEPTFPLDANSPVELLMSVLISLYGIKDLAAFLGIAGVGNEFKEDFQRLKSFHQPPLSWYWEVNVGNPIKTTLGYETTSILAEFKKKISAKHLNQKTVIVGMTKERYDKLSKAKRKVL